MIMMQLTQQGITKKMLSHQTNSVLITLKGEQQIAKYAKKKLRMI